MNVITCLSSTIKVFLFAKIKDFFTNSNFISFLVAILINLKSNKRVLPIYSKMQISKN